MSRYLVRLQSAGGTALTFYPRAKGQAAAIAAAIAEASAIRPDCSGWIAIRVDR